jgi:hypothetical protein
MSAKHTPGRLTDKEMARELFTAGYLKALDDVAMKLALRSGCDIGFIAALRAKAAGVQASAAIAKATGSAA